MSTVPPAEALREANDLLGRLVAEAKLEAIRDFVKRVGERWATSGLNYPECIEQELAAMEKEV